MARLNVLVIAIGALVLASAAQAARPGVTTVRPTPAKPLQGPVVRNTNVGPYGGVNTKATTTRATPLRPLTGPVTTTTGSGPGYAYGAQTATRLTPLVPGVGPVTATRGAAVTRGL